MIENKFLPNKDLIQLRPLEIDVSHLPADAQQDAADNMGVGIQIYYYGVEIDKFSIRQLTISSIALIPELTILFKDQTGLMRSENFPTDDAVLSVYLPSGSKLVKPIRMDFKILTYGETNETGESLTKMICIANVPRLFIRDFKSYSQMSSVDVFKKLASETGMGFNSNIERTKDKMTWINPGQRPLWFIEDVTKHAWNGESGFMWSFIDFYYNLNYVDVEQCLQDKEILLAPLSTMNAAVGDENDALSPMVFSDDSGFELTKNYFRKHIITNNSTNLSLQNGYLKKIAYYDKYGNWGSKAGSLQIFGIDSITTPGAENTSIILKGNPADMEFFKKNISTEWAGKIDTKNTFPDYAYAVVQNAQNINDLQKVSVDIILPAANFAVVRFQKVNLIFTKRMTSEENTRLSGEWLVTGIIYTYNKKNQFSQTIRLVKRELAVK